MGRGSCSDRVLGRRPGCSVDVQAEVEAIQRVSGFGGNVYFVDPNHGRASNQYAGTKADYPLRTIPAAVAKCAANNGDVIAVAFNGGWTFGNPAAGRATPITGAVTLNVPGVHLLGVSDCGTLGVPWMPTADNQTLITVTALDVKIEGFNFWTSLHAGGTGIYAGWNGPPYGEDVRVERCFFFGGSYGVRLDYAWNCYVERCRFQNLVAAAIHNPSVFGEPDYTTIRDNVFIGNGADINLPACDYCLVENNRFIDATAAIVFLTGQDNQIVGNTIRAAAAGTNNMINLTGGATNLVADNYLSCTIAQYDTTCSDATSGSWLDNHCTDGAPVAPPT